MGGENGTSKNTPGGWRAVKDKPKRVTIHNCDNMPCVNILDDIKKYLKLRSSLILSSHEKKRFFCAANTISARIETFFKAQPVSENFIRTSIHAEQTT